MKVWVDCTAAAHPLVLRPIIERLRAAGHGSRSPRASTARPWASSSGSASRTQRRQPCRRAAARKAGPWPRSISLARWARPQRFELALGHGSVDLGVVSALLRIPSVQMQDYEHAGRQRQVAFRVARRVLVPDAIPPDAMRRAGANPRQAVSVPGAEGGLLPRRLPAGPAVLESPIAELGIDRREDEVLVVVRPPPETSAYHAANPLYDEGARSARAACRRRLRW